MSDSPYKTMMSDPEPGMVMQELVTYRLVDGKMRKTVTTRRFYKDDYVDSETTISLEMI